MVPSVLPGRAELHQPAPFLRWLASDPVQLELERIDPIEMWGLVGAATLARLQGDAPMRLEWGHGGSGQFARAVGLSSVVEGVTPSLPSEPQRTFSLSRVQGTSSTEPVADGISKLLLPQPEVDDTRRTLYYVLNELLRNVVQHSQDPLGGVVGAQLNEGGRSRSLPVVQVAVADAGIGVFASLKTRHAQLEDARAALDKALWPHISSAFDEGETGSAQNAGMGLFFISEMTKLVGGRLLIASRGAALMLEGDPQHENPHGTRRFLDSGVEFPGTLVAFEMPAAERNDYDAMIETIRQRAKERTPRRAVHNWLRFEAGPSGMRRYVMKHAQVEDATAAQAFARQDLEPLLLQRQGFALDFMGLSAVTQSYVHALLYEPLRLAWALKVPIHVMNAQPGVRSTLELLENYALGG